MASWAGETAFPGKETVTLPPTPGDRTSREMLTAHRIDDTVRAISHGEERMSAALQAGTPALRGYHSTHIANHMAVALNNMHFLADNVRRHYPAEWAELEAVRQCVGLARSLTRETRVATFAHLIQTVLNELTHAKRHADEMLNPDPGTVWDFNADHVRKHLKGAQEHIDKLSEHVLDNYPGEARWLKLLKRLQDGHLETDEPAWKELKLAASPAMSKAEARYRAAGSAGQRCGSCSMARGWHAPDFESGTCSLVQGLIEEDHVCDHWERDPKVKLAGSVMNTPVPAGRADQYGLHQVPSQTTSPSPPLPPGARLPTPREVRALVTLVPDGIDASLSTGTRKFLETAAVKLEKGDVIEALAALRGAQSSLYSASRKDAGIGMPAVYGASMVPAAEKSSALVQMQRAYREQSGAWRKIGTEVALMIERIRRHWFHGRVNGYSPNLRV